MQEKEHFKHKNHQRSKAININILSVVPVKFDCGWTKYCLSSIKSDLLIIDDNADKDVKDLIKDFPNVIIHASNQYVNYSWNEGIKYFLDGKWDYIAIINSDLRLSNGWECFINEFIDNETIMLPNIVIGNEMPKSINMINHNKEIYSGVAGLFILLSRKMAEIVYPIPSEIKLWFGDNWIFGKLQKQGYKMKIFYHLMAEHGNSRSVSALPNMVEMIEMDKRAWELVKKKI